MTIDIILLILLIMAVFKGLQRGLIAAVFSVLALIIGLAAAIKLSAVVAVYLKDTIHVSAKWLPVLAFVLIFIAVIILVRWAASLIQAAVDFAWLGWANKLGGVLLYAMIYTIIFSIILFYGTKAGIISSQAIASSKTYAIVEPWGPKLIDGIGAVVPVFKDMFKQLEEFFDHISHEIKN
ncbi:MAG: CvpA family protein [Bacteroidetes bacterium]|nr:CvpA family protein [Bacteroidota bacterium]MBS1935311.1 CvpA family protein [Bacteroidota bacterium]